MAATYEGVAVTTGTGDTHTWNKPSGAQADDLLILVLSKDDNDTLSGLAPTGFTFLRQDPGGVTADFGIYYKILTGSEGATFVSGDWGGSADSVGHAILVRGVDTATPIAAHNAAYSDNSVAPNTGSITPSNNGSLIISGVASDTGDGATKPASSTLIDATDGSGAYGACAHETQATAAAIELTWSTSDDDWYGWILAVNPDSGFSGTAANTLAGITQSATGAVPFVGTAASTLGRITQTATGTTSGPTPSVKIQRGTKDVDVSVGATDTTFTAVSALAAAFALNSNNRHSQAGSASSGANHEGDDLSGEIELTGTGTLTFRGEAGSVLADCRFAWELIEYIGAGGGANAFVVRSRNTINVTSNGTGTQALDTTPTNIDRCIPFLVGASCASTVDSWTNATGCFWIDDSGNLAYDIGGDATTDRTFQVVVVEFTGSNWEVYHGDSGVASADSGTITLNTDSDGAGGSTGDVTDWATAVIFDTFKADDDVADDAIADTSAIYFPTPASTTQVDWAFHANRDGTDNRHVVHVLRHPDLAVTRYSDTNSSAGANNIDITSAGLTDLAQSSVVVSRSSSGGGTAYGRGWVNGLLTTLTNVELWAHRSGNTIATEIQVVDWTGITDVAGGGATTGAAANTLGALTQSAAGALAFSGSVDGTLAAVTQSATGGQDHAGTAASFLAAITQLATGDETFSGPAVNTLTAVTQAATGEIPFIGSLASTLAPIGQGTTAALGYAGAATNTLRGITQAATGAVPFVGSIADTLAAISLTAAGAQAYTGTIANALAAVDQAATGAQGYSGIAAATLGAISQSATGHRSTDGTAANTFGAIVQAVTGGLGFAGNVASALGAVTQAATGAVPFVGSVSGALAAVQQAAAGAQAYIGTSANALAAVDQAATGAQVYSGTAAATLGAISQSATGHRSTDGTAANTLGAIVQAVTGGFGFAGTAASTLGAVTQVATGGVPFVGVAINALASVGQTATGAEGYAGTAASALGSISQAVNGHRSTDGTVALTFGAIVQAVTGELGLAGTAASTLGAVTQVATGDVPFVGVAANSLSPMSQAASAALKFEGVTADTLPSIGQAAVGVQSQSSIGQVDNSLAAVAQNASGILGFSGAVGSVLGSIGQGVAGGLVAEAVDLAPVESAADRAALFAEFAEAAIYTPAIGDPIDISVVPSVPGEVHGLSLTDIAAPTRLALVRASELPTGAPARGDMMTMAGETYRVRKGEADISGEIVTLDLALQTPALGFGSTTFEAAADLATFFDTDEFAELGTYTLAAGGSALVRVILDRPHESLDLSLTGVSVPARRAQVRFSELPGTPGRGDTLVVGDETYRVKSALSGIAGNLIDLDLALQTPATGRSTSAFESSADLEVFFDAAEFAVAATYMLGVGGSATVTVIMDAPDDTLGVGVRVPVRRALMRAAELPEGAPGDDDTMTIGAEVYKVRKAEPDITGAVVMLDLALQI